MKYRKLRIAWSVAWGVVAVLFGLWSVRSYGVVDTLATPPVAIVSREGSVDSRTRFNELTAPGQPKIQWAYSAIDVNHWNRIAQNAWRTTKPVERVHWSFHASTRVISVRFPHWFGSLLSALCAALPWLRWSLHFSLRTVLLVITVVSVVLGVIVWTSQR